MAGKTGSQYLDALVVFYDEYVKQIEQYGLKLEELDRLIQRTDIS